MSEQTVDVPASTAPAVSRLTRGTIWLLSGTMTARALTLASSLIMANVLGKKGFGELGIIQSTVLMLNTFASAGCSLTSTKYVAEYRVKDPAKAGRILSLSLIISAVAGAIISMSLFLSATWLAEKTLAAPHLIHQIRMAAPLIFFATLSGTQTGAIIGLEAFQANAILTLLSSMLLLFCTYAGVELWGINGAVCGMVASACITSAINQVWLNSLCKQSRIQLNFGHANQELGVLWRFSLPAALAGVLVGPVNWACTAILVNQPAGYAEMGIFNAANQWRTMLLFLPNVIGSVTIPVLSKFWGDKDTRNFYQFFKTNLVITIAVTAIPVCAINFVPNLCMRIFGLEFEAGGSILSLLTISAIFMAATGVMGHTLISNGQMWAGFIFNFFWAVTLVCACWTLRTHGAYGLAIANLIAYLVHLIVLVLFILLTNASIRQPDNHNPTAEC